MRTVLLKLSPLWLWGLFVLISAWQSQPAPVSAPLSPLPSAADLPGDALSRVSMLLDSANRMEQIIALDLETGQTIDQHQARLKQMVVFIEYIRSEVAILNNPDELLGMQPQLSGLLLRYLFQDLDQKQTWALRLTNALEGIPVAPDQSISLDDLQQREILQLEEILDLKIKALQQAESKLKQLNSKN